jgi:hypothetical protein
MVFVYVVMYQNRFARLLCPELTMMAPQFTTIGNALWKGYLDTTTGHVFPKMFSNTFALVMHVSETKLIGSSLEDVWNHYRFRGIDGLRYPWILWVLSRRQRMALIPSSSCRIMEPKEFESNHVCRQIQPEM